MKKVLLLAGALMLTASAAFAQGINLNWNDCTLGAAQMHLAAPSCTEFGAPLKLIVSLNPGPAAITNVNGAQGLIDIQSDAATLPDYWRFDGCRAGRLSADVAVGSGNAPFNCPEPWASGGGNQAGGAGFAVTGANRGRIAWVVAIPATTTLDSNVAPDWYLMALNLLKTGSSSCAGCTGSAALVANEVLLTKPAGTPGGDVLVTNPAVGNCALFGPNAMTNPGCGATPTLNTTWGQVKSLYR